MLIFVTQITLIFVNSIVFSSCRHPYPPRSQWWFITDWPSPHIQYCTTTLLFYCSSSCKFRPQWTRALTQVEASDRQAQQHPRTIWRYRNADFRMDIQYCTTTLLFHCSSSCKFRPQWTRGLTQVETKWQTSATTS